MPLRPLRLLARCALLALAGHAVAAGGSLGFNPSDSILVVAPHPDDEVLCCAGVLSRAAAAGAKVAVVWLTGGDAFELDARLVEHQLRPGREGLLQLGLQRADEGREAATTLGIPRDAQFVLGYPDRGIQHLAIENYFVRYRSPFTGSDTVFLPGALTAAAPYEGQSLVQDLRTVLEHQNPDYVFVASPIDAHPDHRVSGELIIRLMGERGQLDRVYYWIVHGGFDWPRPRGLHLDRQLAPPRHARALEWMSFELTADEQQTKLRALAAHRSQLRIMRPFLESFVRRNELFTRAVALPEAPVPSFSPESSIIAQPDSKEIAP